MISKQILFLLILLGLTINAQQITVSGKVVDAKTNNPLSFANIRVSGTTLGTATNSDGLFELRLDSSDVTLIVSYIGFYSDTVNLKQTGYKNITVSLNSTDIELSEVVIKPGENPAIDIIRKTIERKKTRNNLLNNYIVEAYTKGVIRTTEDISASGSGINVGLGGNDTSDLKITGILENHSRGYFKKPDKYKEIILARKQSANFPSSINILTGGRLIQNFYENDINFLGRDLPGPISDNALNYYYYYIEIMLAQNNKKIYQIHMEPNNPANPGFEGNIFISDSTYDLVKVDLILNRAANTGRLFDTVNIYQQFDTYDQIMMPVDYRLFVKANVLGLVRFGFELNTIMFNYSINGNIADETFDKAIVTVIPEADSVDLSYWQNTQTIPNTPEEQMAYNRIDSLKNIPKNFLDDYSLLDTRINLSDNFSISAPISMYHFSRVEGHSIDFGLFARNGFNRRFNGSINLSYGFSDKRFKQELAAEYLIGNYRTWKIKLSAFNKTKIFFEQSDNYGDLISTLVTLISKDEFRDYYYSKGFSVGVEGEILPELRLKLGFNNKTDNTAYNTSDFSIFNTTKTYRINTPVYETRINVLNFGFDIDFRDYVEDGYFRRRTSLGRSFILFSGNINYSNPDLINSGLKFTTYEFTASAFIKTFSSSFLNLIIYGRYTDGASPVQDLFALPGNIDGVFNSQTFRTLRLNEVAGDRAVTLNLVHDFRDEIFRWLNIPGIKNREIMLSLIFNAAISDINQQTEIISPVKIKTFKHPFYEIGFGVGQGLLPFKIEFMWKLNYKDGNNFRVGLNMPLL